MHLSKTNNPANNAINSTQAPRELSEFQEELVWLSCSINGEAVPECPTVEDAANYVVNSVTKFFDAAAAAKTEGSLNPNHILQL